MVQKVGELSWFERMTKEFERWPKIKAAYIRAFDRAIQRRRETGKEIGQENGLEMFNWWIQETKRKVDPDQTVMFE